MGWRRHRLLIWALGISVLLHAALLLVRVVPPEQLQRVLPAQALELILVNASTDEAPVRPTALAQVNLDGGGLADAAEATTPLEASRHWKSGNDLQEAESQNKRMRQEQELLLAQVRAQMARLDAAQAADAQQDGESAKQQLEKRKALAALLARIERTIQEQNSRPRKRFITASAKRATYAMYYDRVRQQVEADGTAHFPVHNDKRLYGDLTVGFTVNHDGRVLDAEVLVSSKQVALDAATLALVRRQRFANFDAALRRDADQLGVISTFHFTRDNQVRSELLGQ